MIPSESPKLYRPPLQAAGQDRAWGHVRVSAGLCVPACVLTRMDTLTGQQGGSIQGKLKRWLPCCSGPGCGDRAGKVPVCPTPTESQ